ncbi:MAG: protein arginine kinase [Candidatus Krumholzibacteriota bacterium]|nr:protein arginine kinase [Candidatus Krumholzibacteriota bacterium]
MKEDFERLTGESVDWIVNGSFEDDIVLSTRVRLARNLEDWAFPHWSKEGLLEKLDSKIKKAVLKTKLLSDALVIDMDELSDMERMVLAERRLISRNMVKFFKNRSLIVSEDERLGVMINEEDHLRLYATDAGLSVKKVFSLVNSLDNQLDKKLNFAFSARFGYLTACPTNVGTGLRISTLVHLPGLVSNNDIRQVVDGLRHVRLSVRGTYGEGSEVIGNFFQISNSVTLGLSEIETAENMEMHIKKVIEFEKKARDSLMKEAHTLLEDRICRSFGVLKNARIISSKEAMKLISEVRMGVGMGIVSGVKLNNLNEMLSRIQPIHLQQYSGKAMTPDERDIARADLIRSILKENGNR